ncbi:MAG: isopentenyl-diphosphate delta-isomerase, partial [Psychromonas sp.]
MISDLTLQNEVVLVDAQDRPLGTMEKMRAHVEGKLHRAFSVLLFNQNGETLIQKRALDKYHSGGLWSNTCCSHPFPNEPILDAGVRR